LKFNLFKKKQVLNKKNIEEEKANSVTPNINNQFPSFPKPQNTANQSQQEKPNYDIFSKTIIPPPPLKNREDLEPREQNTQPTIKQHNQTQQTIQESQFNTASQPTLQPPLHHIEPISTTPTPEQVPQHEVVDKAKGLNALNTGLEDYETQETPYKTVGKEVFVSVTDYKGILKELKNMKTLLDNINSIIDDIKSEDKKQEETLEEWRSVLEDIERKILFVDKILFGE